MASGKVVGRILSLGFPLPGPQVDNYNFASAPSFFDYDALVVDLNALSAMIEGVINGSVEATTLSGAPVRNAAATVDAASLADVLLRRRDETARLLSNGGFVVCFVHLPRTHSGIAGSPDLDDVCWLPDAIADACRPPALVAGEGTQALVVDYQHPFAAFAVSQLANIDYRACVQEEHAPKGLRAFIRSRGGAAIGVDVQADAGRVVLLPALRALPSGDARYAMSDALQAGIRQALGATAPGHEPPWLSRAYPLPGLAERTDALEVARSARDDAQRSLDDAEAAHDELARYRRLLWQEGTAGLNPIVIDALKLIGFDVYAQDPNALEIRSADQHVLVEIDASEHPIGLAAHYRLRQRIEQAIERRGVAPRGLLIVNGRRLLPPGERTDEISDALRLASETMRYTIATTASLFAAVAAQLDHDDAAVEAYRCLLRTEDGVLSPAITA